MSYDSNSIYQKVLKETEKYLPNPVGILDKDNLKFTDTVQNQVITRQNNVIIGLILELHKQVKDLEAKLVNKQDDNLNIDELINKIGNLNIGSKTEIKNKKEYIFYKYRK